ncbi:MAG: ABC transporter substrate-binding protein, partial [Micromonosporaceae bacterium]
MKRLITCAIAAAMALAGCGSPTATDSGGDKRGAAAYHKVYAKLDGLSGQQRAEKLTALAKKEGTLVWYTAMQQELAEALAEKFTDAYGIKVDMYRADRTEVLQRVSEESSARYKAGADVVETPGAEMALLAEEGLFVPYRSPIRDSLVEDARFEDWTAERFNVQVPAWNTKKLPKAERPTSLRDLADSRYDGELTLGAEDADWFATVSGYWKSQGMSQAEIDKTFRAMADRAFVMSGHSERANLLAAGQFGLSASHYTHVNAGLIDDGAPVGYEPIVEPAILGPNGTALMSSARHPAAAVLFMDWLMSDGQQVIAKSGTMPARADLFEKSDISSAQQVVIDVEG